MHSLSGHVNGSSINLELEWGAYQWVHGGDVDVIAPGVESNRSTVRVSVAYTKIINVK